MITSERVDVTNEATLIVGAGGRDYTPGQSALIRNRSGVAIDLGGSDVTSGTGYTLDADEAFPITLEQGESLYGCAATVGPHRVDVLRQGVAG